MQKLILLMACVASSWALADDGGVIGIKVNELKFEKTAINGERTTVTKLPTTDLSSYQITANGNEATKLMQILPSELSVETTMHPGFAATYNKNFKELAITGPPGSPYVSIYCEGGAMDYNHASADGSPKFIPHRDGAHCTISVAAPVEDEIPQYRFDPKKAVCGH